jgi:hypothetical protein
MGFHATHPGRCSKIADSAIIMRRLATVVATLQRATLASAGSHAPLSPSCLNTSKRTSWASILHTFCSLPSRADSTRESKSSLCSIRVCIPACPPYMRCHVLMTADPVPRGTFHVQGLTLPANSMRQAFSILTLDRTDEK